MEEKVFANLLLKVVNCHVDILRNQRKPEKKHGRKMSERSFETNEKRVRE